MVAAEARATWAERVVAGVAGEALERVVTGVASGGGATCADSFPAAGAAATAGAVTSGATPVVEAAVAVAALVGAANWSTALCRVAKRSEERRGGKECA